MPASGPSSASATRSRSSAAARGRGAPGAPGRAAARRPPSTPPPITITSGSKMFAKLESADAEAAPDRRPTTSSAMPSPASAASVTVLPVDLAAGGERPAERRVGCVCGAPGALAASAVPDASASTQPRLGQLPWHAGRRRRSRRGRARRRRRSSPGRARPSRMRPPPIPVPIVSRTTLRAPRATPKRCSASAATLASLSTKTGTPSRSRHQVADRHVGDRQVDGGDREPALAVDRARDAEPDRLDVGHAPRARSRSSRSSVSRARRG